MVSPQSLYLASSSTPRRQLLEQLGYEVKGQCAPDVDERQFPGEPLADYVTRVTCLKAVAGRVLFPTGCVVAADTAMSLDGCVLGKPRNTGDALAMLLMLSGRTHQVMTAVSVAGPNGVLHGCATADVTFRPLSPCEVEAYCRTGEPFGKAGGYALQGRGAQFVVHLSGSASAVMGLPLAETAALLRRQGFDLLA